MFNTEIIFHKVKKLQSLVESMPQRIAAIIKARGSHLKYSLSEILMLQTSVVMNCVKFCEQIMFNLIEFKNLKCACYCLILFMLNALFVF